LLLSNVSIDLNLGSLLIETNDVFAANPATATPSSVPVGRQLSPIEKDVEVILKQLHHLSEELEEYIAERKYQQVTNTQHVKYHSNNNKSLNRFTLNRLWMQLRSRRDILKRRRWEYWIPHNK